MTLSWEGGLRGEAYAERMFDALERMQHLMGARHYVHLRFETTWAASIWPSNGSATAACAS